MRWTTLLSIFAVMLLLAPVAATAQSVTQIIDSSGDGTAPLLRPGGIAVDPHGSVYVAGYVSSNVFEVDASGGITEMMNSSGDGTNALLGASDIAIFSYFDIPVLSAGRPDAGLQIGSGTLPAQECCLFVWVYVAGYDSDNVFVIEPGKAPLELIDSTGDGTTNLDRPEYLATSTNSNAVYVSGTSAFSNAVFEIQRESPPVTWPLAKIIDHTGDGSHALAGPAGLALDTTGNVYVAGQASDNVFKVTPSGTVTEIIDVTGDGLSLLTDPVDVATDDDDNLYVLGATSGNIFKITSAGLITEILPSGSLVFGARLAVSPGGTVYVTDVSADRVLEITPSGAISEILDASGDGTHPLIEPYGIAVDAAGDVYVTGLGSNNAFKITLSGTGCGLDTDADGVGDLCDNCRIRPNPDQDDQDSDGVGDACDNCPDIPNANQLNQDGDPYGDRCDGCPTQSCWGSRSDSDKDGFCDGCDNCPNDFNPNQEDTTEVQQGYSPDRVGDVCDNCLTLRNYSQEDVNGDGVGDACDCFDVAQGEYEKGIDCGYPCDPCVRCTWCSGDVAPVRIKGGHNSGQIDVVFVPEESYRNNLSKFADDVVDYIRNGYFQLHTTTVAPIPNDYRDRFNFYRYTGGFGEEGSCAGRLPGMSDYYKFLAWCIPTCASVPFGLGCLCWFDEPETFKTHAPFADSAAILTNGGVHGCASSLGTPSHWIADDRGTAIHESAHSIFGLVDEYCGDTLYEQNDPDSNVWGSKENCLADAAAEGWTTGTCRQITWDDPTTSGLDCSKSFWRYDPDPAGSVNDVMMCGCDNTTVYQFGEADTRRMNMVFDAWPWYGSPGVMLHLNIKNSVITPLYATVVDSHPDVGMQYASIVAEAFSSTGELLDQFGVWDPRIELGETAVYTDEVNFHITFPFYEDLETLTLSDPVSGEILTSVDLKEILETYVACPHAPTNGCAAAGKATFQIAAKGSDERKHQLKWKWRKGSEFDGNACGNPDAQTPYALCIYDHSSDSPSLVAEIHIDPGSLWQSSTSGRWKYNDKQALHDGVQKVQVKPGGAGRSKVDVKAKGVNIPMPRPLDGADPGKFFDQDPKLTVQLVNGEDFCWTSQFTAPQTKKNEANKFKAIAK